MLGPNSDFKAAKQLNLDCPHDWRITQAAKMVSYPFDAEDLYDEESEEEVDLNAVRDFLSNIPSANLPEGFFVVVLDNIETGDEYCGIVDANGW